MSISRAGLRFTIYPGGDTSPTTHSASQSMELDDDSFFSSPRQPNRYGILKQRKVSYNSRPREFKRDGDGLLAADYRTKETAELSLKCLINLTGELKAMAPDDDTMVQKLRDLLQQKCQEIGNVKQLSDDALEKNISLTATWNHSLSDNFLPCHSSLRNKYRELRAEKKARGINDLRLSF